MQAELDPYFDWLGIPKASQPPDYYTLLGLERFEASLEAIQMAATRQRALVRTLRSSAPAAVSRKLLDEMSDALACLLDPESKARYDTRLRHRRDDAPAPPSPVSTDAGVEFDLHQPPPRVSAAAEVQIDSQQPIAAEPTPYVSRRQRSRASRRRRYYLAVAIAAAVVLLLTGVILVNVEPANVMTRVRQALSTAGQESDDDSQGTLRGEDSKDQTGGSPRDALGQVEHKSEDQPLGNRASQRPTAPLRHETPTRPPTAEQTTRAATNETPTPDSRPAQGPRHGPPSADTTRQASGRDRFSVVHAAMADRKPKEARRTFESIIAEANAPVANAEVARLRQLLEHHERFWKAVTAAREALVAGEELLIGGQRAVVVDARGERLVIRVAGENRRYTNDNLPAKLATILAERQIGRDNPAALLAAATFHALDRAGDRRQARALCDEAADRGVEAELIDDVLAALRELEPTVPAQEDR